MSDNPDFAENRGERAAALAGDARAVQHLKDAVNAGRNWYVALLEAIRLWRSPEEIYKGGSYVYLISGEAFDWLRLAERLCDEIKDSVPEEELVSLLFFDRPPVELSESNFKELIGPAKYRAYLNYLYGVLTEQALLLGAIYEARKRNIVPLKPDEEAEQAYRAVYHAGQAELLHAFQKELKYPHIKSLTMGQLKEFTYWLFKYRVSHSEKPKVASDTKKALALLYRKLSSRNT